VQLHSTSTFSEWMVDQATESAAKIKAQGYEHTLHACDLGGCLDGGVMG
jgi:hypothetical protein